LRPARIIQETDDPFGSGGGRGGSGTVSAAGEHALTVLVVVLDEDVRGLIRDMLERSDCHVLVAADEAQALAVAGSAEIDLLLTEVAPLVDGRSIAERLRVRRPGLPVLYITAWFDHPDFAELKGEPIVREPFSPAELTRAIDAVLRSDPRL
jgi:DNA-binding response OmpR family regulator